MLPIDKFGFVRIRICKSVAFGCEKPGQLLQMNGIHEIQTSTDILTITQTQCPAQKQEIMITRVHPDYEARRFPVERGGFSF